MKNYFRLYVFRISFILFFTLLSFENSKAQELFVGSNAEFYLKTNTNFTTSNTVVTLDSSGKFSVEASSDWGSSQEYVNGEVNAYGDGETKLPIGNNGVYAPVMANHTGNITGSYFNSAPTSGSNGADVDAVSNMEYWKLTGNAIITLPWNDNSDITSLVNNNGGKLSSVSIVGYDSGVWNLVSASQTNVVTGDLLNGDVTSDINNEVNLDGYTQFTFGIDHQAVLAVNDLFLSNGISILSNPVKASNRNIQFRSSNELKGLKVTLYNILGEKIKYYRNVSIYNGIGTLRKPNLDNGIYLLRFDYEGKQGVKKIIIE